ncbi:MAG: phosphatase PAP2 family protein [Muribaculaceae bacterium]|nr:phosphatase PAP2 family protein [Muribaculaceae bacterium]
MIDYLTDIDTDALLAINGLHDMFQDAFWMMVSAKWSSLLIVLGLVWILMHKNRRHALLVIAMLVLAFIVADQLSSGLIKHLVERLRPTHEPSLDGMVHTVNNYRGGMYGFVSSHAANSFAALTLVSLVMRHRFVIISLFTWALLQCYSRVYLGVHYPGDILGGIVVGLAVGWLVWLLMRWLSKRLNILEATYTASDAVVITSSVALTIVVLVLAATFQTW